MPHEVLDEPARHRRSEQGLPGGDDADGHLTTDPAAWYAYQGVVGAVVVAGLAVYGFVTATRGRRLFREGLFGDE